MPHDLNGLPLKVGDVVAVPCVVTAIHEGTDYCNVTLETVEKMFPGEHKSGFTLNGKQIILTTRA